MTAALDLAQIRLENAMRLFDEFVHQAARNPDAATLRGLEGRFAERLQIQPSYWSQIKSRSRQIGERLARQFGCVVRNSYGASEFLSIAWDCGAGRLHVNGDWVLLEPVDAQLRPVAPGTASHTTLLTNLVNRVQPLIRYDLGDAITVHPDRCRCGCPLPTIEVDGRHDDIGFDGMQLISDIRIIYDNYDFATEILVASVRHPVHVLESAKIGADVMTAPPAVIRALFNHPLTDKGIEGFLADWAKTGQTIG